MTPSLYSMSRTALVLAAIVMQTACVPYVYKHYALVLDDEWSDRCVAKGQLQERYPSEALGQFWVREVCLAYRHTMDDLVVHVDASVEHTLVITVTDQGKPRSWQKIGSTNTCDVESQLGDEVFETFLTSGLQQDVQDRKDRLEVLKKAYSSALTSVSVLHEEAIPALKAIDIDLARLIIKAANGYSASLSAVFRSNENGEGYQAALSALDELEKLSDALAYDFQGMRSALDDLNAKYVKARPQRAAGRDNLFHANVGFSPYFYYSSLRSSKSKPCPGGPIPNPVMVTLQPYGNELEIKIPVRIQHNGYNWIWDAV